MTKISSYYEFEGKAIKKVLDCMNTEIEERKTFIEEAIKTGSEDLTLKKASENLVKLLEAKKNTIEFLQETRKKYEESKTAEKEEAIKNGKN